MTDVHGWYHCTDLWRKRDIESLRAQLELSSNVDNRSALIVGCGFMPFMLDVIKPDHITFVDYHEGVVRSVAQRVEAMNHAKSWLEYTEIVKQDLDEHPNRLNGFNTEIAKAAKLGLLHQKYDKVRKIAERATIATIIGDITTDSTALEVAESLEGTVPIFVNLTNVASHIERQKRKMGQRKDMQVAWDITKRFMDIAGVPNEAIVADSDDFLLNTKIYRRSEYRV